MYAGSACAQKSPAEMFRYMSMCRMLAAMTALPSMGRYGLPRCVFASGKSTTQKAKRLSTRSSSDKAVMSIEDAMTKGTLPTRERRGVWPTWMCNGTRRKAGGQQSTRGAVVAVLKTGPNPTTAVRVFGSRTRCRAFGKRRGVAALRCCTARRRSTVSPAGTPRRAPVSQRGPSPTAQANHARAGRAVAATVSTRVHRWGAHAPARRRTPRWRTKEKAADRRS